MERDQGLKLLRIIGKMFESFSILNTLRKCVTTS